VPKGPDDIRVVYHGSKSGLNAQLWTPRFYMPNGSAATNLMSFETYLTDSDVGEIFPNFAMDPKLRPHAGVDLRSLSHCLKNYETPISDEESELWERLFMGMAPSPYIAIRMYYVAEEFCRGPASAKDNPMGYDEVRLNLPGSSDYNPSLPRVMKWNQAAKAIAGDVVTFVDDLRASGHSVENSWQVSRQLGSQLQYLGIQDAPRKRRPPSQTPGAWAGGIFLSANGRITKYFSVEKWKRGQTMIRWLQDEVNDCPNNRLWLNFKRLESTAAFLCHLSMTHEGFRPFLKEIYLTLNSWRSQRDEDGWKIPDKRWVAYLAGCEDAGSPVPSHDQAAPATVQTTPGFEDGITALAQLFLPDEPPCLQVRSSAILSVIYRFGDASGKGFGSALQEIKEAGISIRIGVWSWTESKESSNWKEFTNCIEALEAEGVAGRLNQTLIYLFTENSTVEFALYKGTSSSR
jgi:hypothetical protein